MKLSNNIYEAYLTRNKLISGGAIKPHWSVDGLNFWYADGAPYNTVIYQVDVISGDKKSMFDIARLRAAITDATGYESPYKGLPFDSIELVKDDKVEFVLEGDRWRLDLITHKLTRLDDAGFYADYAGRVSGTQRVSEKNWQRAGGICWWKGPVPEQGSPDGQWFVSVEANNLMLRSIVDGRYQRLTTDGSDFCFWDIDAPSAAKSQGMLDPDAITPWSPDSLTLLAYQRDISDIYYKPQIHWLKSLEEVEYLPIYKAGSPIDKFQPMFIDIRSGKRTPIPLDTIEDRYIQLLGWLPSGDEALLIIYERDFKALKIVAANVADGSVRTVLTESAETFVKLQHSALSYDSGFKLLVDGAGFLWSSTADGFNHIYHYDIQGTLIAQLTQGNWPVYAIYQVSEDGFVYFTAAIDLARPYDVHVCRVPLTGGAVQRLTETTGIHKPVFAPNNAAEYFLDTHATVDRPTSTELVKIDGTQRSTLAKMDISRLQAVGYIPAEEYTVKAADGETDLWGVMYKPFDFDPEKSYPVIEYIYGGPQINAPERGFSVGENKFHSNLSWALAQLGYIVVCMDARGTPGRSKAFQDVVYQAWNINVIPDHAAAIQQLCERNTWMDKNRVGITGHSWGGYYSTAALIQAPDVYCAAVSSSSGAYDFWNYAIHEPYLGLPKDNRAAYDDASLVNRAAEVQGKLMLVGGTSDNISSPIKMTHALMNAGIDHDFVLLPGAGHSYAEKEEDYFLMKLTGWFERHVKNRELL